MFEQLNIHVQYLAFTIAVAALVTAYAAGLAWVYSDAETNRRSGCLWLLFSVLAGPLGVLLYILTINLPRDESKDSGTKL